MIEDNISVVAFLQSVAPHLATQLTRERLELMEQIGGLVEQRDAARAALAEAVELIRKLDDSLQYDDDEVAAFLAAHPPAARETGAGTTEKQP